MATKHITRTQRRGNSKTITAKRGKKVPPQSKPGKVSFPVGRSASYTKSGPGRKAHAS